MSHRAGKEPLLAMKVLAARRRDVDGSRLLVDRLGLSTAAGWSSRVGVG